MPYKSPCIKPPSAKLAPELVMPDLEKVLSSGGNKDFYTNVMVNGKPVKVFVIAKEVQIKKEKDEKSEGPIAQSSGKEEQNSESDKNSMDFSTTQGSSALNKISQGQDKNKLIKLMNNETTEPSLSDTETSGTKDETKDESNTETEKEENESVHKSDRKESENESDRKKSDTKMEGNQSANECDGKESAKGNKGKESANKSEEKGAKGNKEKESANKSDGKASASESANESEENKSSNESDRKVTGNETEGKESGTEKEGEKRRETEIVKTEMEDSSEDSSEEEEIDTDEKFTIPTKSSSDENNGKLMKFKEFYFIVQEESNAVKE